ncbi:F0F1 ATP synthase subunit B [Paludisphaera rhizosphaerae]|uniref:F0F1 ATP synthase subunit B n=1 Tax=Paludisphaera rhizosphaerae TaxID=2711216 RepID=UPI0013ED2CA7|nr:F0F1 ATP synthase subunit B [Paludisphaera rhizosphaerae]
MLRFLKSALGSGLVATAAAALLAPQASAIEEPPAAHAAPAQAAAHAPAAPASSVAAAPAHAATAPAHEEEHKANPMEPQMGLAIWTVVVFGCLFALLSKYAWGPLTEALHSREEHLEHTLHQTEKARNDAELLLAEHRKLMAESDDKVRDLLYQAQRKAETRATEILRQAQSDADASRDRAQREIAAARDQALADIWTRTADVAVTVAGRALSRELSDNERSRLLDEAIRDLPAAPAKSGGASA